MADNDKAIAAVSYVFGNTNYVDDLTFYGSPDYWMDPRGTIYYSSGDCEDFAFFVHSLLLAGSITGSRLRTYFGYLNSVGHSWVTYKRDSDGEWVILDATAGVITDIETLPLAKDSVNYANAWAYLTDEAYVVIPDGEYLNSYELTDGSITLPVFKLSAVGVQDWIGQGTFPSLTCLSYGGGIASLSFKALTAIGTGKTVNRGIASNNLSHLTIAATGKTGIIGTGTLTWGALSVSASGFGVPAAQGSQSFPSFTMVASGSSDRFDGYILRYSRQ